MWGTFLGLAILNVVCPQGFLEKCFSHVNAHGTISWRCCPGCLTRIKAVFLQDCDPPLELDFCLNCQSLWFDSDELKRLPKKSKNEKALLEAERLKIDIAKLELKKENEMRALQTLHVFPALYNMMA